VVQIHEERKDGRCARALSLPLPSAWHGGLGTSLPGLLLLREACLHRRRLRRASDRLPVDQHLRTARSSYVSSRIVLSATYKPRASDAAAAAATRRVLHQLTFFVDALWPQPDLPTEIQLDIIRQAGLEHEQGTDKAGWKRLLKSLSLVCREWTVRLCAACSPRTTLVRPRADFHSHRPAEGGPERALSPTRCRISRAVSDARGLSAPRPLR